MIQPQESAIDGIIQVERSAKNVPAVIDLNHLFGARGLRFRAAVESFGVVDLKLAEASGMLSVAASPYCQADQRTRLAVRAADDAGCEVVAVMDVVVSRAVESGLRAV